MHRQSSPQVSNRQQVSHDVFYHNTPRKSDCSKASHFSKENNHCTPFASAQKEKSALVAKYKARSQANSQAGSRTASRPLSPKHSHPQRKITSNQKTSACRSDSKAQMTFNAKQCHECVNKTLVSQKVERQQQERAQDREYLEEAKKNEKMDSGQKESSFRRRQQYYREYKESLQQQISAKRPQGSREGGGTGVDICNPYLNKHVDSPAENGRQLRQQMEG